MAKTFAWVLLSLLLSLNHVQSRKPTFKAIDLFGSSQITLEQVNRRVGDKIKKFAEAFSNGDDAAESIYKEIISDIRGMGKFAYARLGLVSYPPDNDFYITIDLVDEADRARRMSFLPEPTGEISDPENLLALWGEYEAIAFELVRKGELNFVVTKCPALHCLFGFDHPALKKFQEAFDEKIPVNKELLIKILREDKDSDHRTHAAYLLAHTKDATELVRILLPSIADSQSGVRNSMLRVLMYLATGKDVDIPIEPILKALDYPDTTDRNKTLYILDGLAERAENKPILMKKAGAMLIKILRLWQPNNHDPAFSILKKISGKNFGERDYRAWEKWLSSQTAITSRSHR